MNSTVAVPGAAGSRASLDLGQLVRSPTAWFSLAALALVAQVARQTAGAPGLSFSAQGLQNIGQILAPVVLMSLFIERATEVVISSWRDPEAQRLQHDCDSATGDSQVYAQRALDFYRIDTMRLAFVLSFSLAVITALVGFRVVQPLMDARSIAALKGTSQLLWFNRLDIVLAGLLMAGGANGIHKIVTTFTAFLDATRNRAAAQPNAAAGAQPAQAPLAAAPVQQNLAAQTQAAGAPAAPRADNFDDGV